MYWRNMKKKTCRKLEQQHARCCAEQNMFYEKPDMHSSYMATKISGSPVFLYRDDC
jgi:hypothetical protein